MDKKEIDSLLKYGAYDLFNERADQASAKFCEDDIDTILQERATVIKSGGSQVSLCCAVLCCAVLCCAVLCDAVLCCAVLCCAVLCCVVLCCAVLCCAMLCCAVLCCAGLPCLGLGAWSVLSDGRLDWNDVWCNVAREGDALSSFFFFLSFAVGGGGADVCARAFIYVRISVSRRDADVCVCVRVCVYVFLFSCVDQKDEPKEAAGSSSFSKATFQTGDTAAEVDVHAPDFWEQLLPDMSSAVRLLAQLNDGDAYGSEEKKATFLERLRDKVTDCIAGQHQGLMPENVDMLLMVLKVLSECEHFSDDVKLRAFEWMQDIERPRRQRRAAERFDATIRRTGASAHVIYTNGRAITACFVPHSYTRMHASWYV